MVDLGRAIDGYQSRLDELADAVIARLVDDFESSIRRLEALLAQLLLEIGDNRPTPGHLQRMEEYRRLIAQAEAELDALTTATTNEIERIAPSSYWLGLAAAGALLYLLTNGAMGTPPSSGPIVFPPPVSGGAPIAPPSALDFLQQMLDPSGPLYERLRLLTGYNLDAVVRTMLDGLTRGYNPRKIAQMLRDAFGGGLTDALRFTRTAQLYAYRRANQAAFLASGVNSWVWRTSFKNSCMSCIAQHGTIHPATELLADHHNGACAMIPLVDGYDNPIAETGAQWFEKQSEAEQKRLMGRLYWDAWRGGAFQLSDIPDVRNDPVYGPMNCIAPLWKLLGAEPPVRM